MDDLYTAAALQAAVGAAVEACAALVDKGIPEGGVACSMAQFVTINEWRAYRNGCEKYSEAIRALYPAALTAYRDALSAAEARGMPDADRLAQIIRTVDGDHTLGAGALAEAILAAMKEQGHE